MPSKLHNFEQNYVNYLNLTIQLSSPVKNTVIQMASGNIAFLVLEIVLHTQLINMVKRLPLSRLLLPVFLISGHEMNWFSFLLVQKNTKHITFLLYQMNSLKSGEEKVWNNRCYFITVLRLYFSTVLTDFAKTVPYKLENVEVLDIFHCFPLHFSAFRQTFFIRNKFTKTIR